MHPKTDSPRSTAPAFLWLGYMLFVVYGSLVPLDYVARPLDEAWAAFQNIPFLNLGVRSRADWVANGVLYVPAAFLTANLLVQVFRGVPRLFLFAVAAAFSMAVAVAVEFTQLFFPPRTVSLNDIAAECIGTLVGVTLYARYSNWFQALLLSLLRTPHRLNALLLEGYVFAYCAFAFFPYDLLLSWPELQAKIDSPAWGWLIAYDPSRVSIVALQLAVEVLLTAPLGLLLARAAGMRGKKYGLAFCAGLVFGGGVEAAQFFLASGVSQGLSVFTRALGVVLGLAMYQHRERWTADQTARILKRYRAPIGIAYLLALLEINGWFSARWHGADAAAAQLAQTRFIPFYYHYFTSEVRALFSLMSVCLAYAPVAIMCWAHRRTPNFALWACVSLATFIEASKLFIQGTHPDPTNILLAGATGWLGLQLMRQLALKVEPQPARTLTVEPNIRTKPTRSDVSPIGLVLALAATGLWIVAFPVFHLLLLVLFSACVFVVWRRPVLVFGIIPAALPVFDLAHWSGRYFLDEFDALLLVGLAVAYVRAPRPGNGRVRADPLVTLAATLVGLSFAISAMRGLLPFQPPDANAFNNYFSPYNAIRIAKGAVWAFLVYRLAGRFVAAGVDARRAFSWGMVAGLALTVVVIIWERSAFPGLWDFSHDYRVTGPFSALHTGGAYIECFLAVATPYLLVLLLEKRHWLVRLALLSLMLASTYAMMVTFSRGGYAAFAVATLVVLTSALSQSKLHLGRGLIGAVLTMGMLMVAAPIYLGGFAQSRMALVAADLDIRQAHWDEALDIRDDSWVDSLFGMGLGRFPEALYWRSTLHPRPGTYRLERDKRNTFLRIGAGNPIGIEQLVSVEPGKTYVLQLDARPSQPSAKITVPICEKWLLTSYNCISLTMDLGPQSDKWRAVEAPFKTDHLAVGPWFSQRPVKLSLAYPVRTATVDIDNVRLLSEDGSNLLRNGDFSQGLDHWLFATAGALHLHWRVHSLFYGVLFDQGWFGVAALGAFLGLALGRALKNTTRGSTISSAALASLLAFLTIGALDTLVDAPRFLLLLFLLAWACLHPQLVPTGRHTPADRAFKGTS